MKKKGTVATLLLWIIFFNKIYAQKDTLQHSLNYFAEIGGLTATNSRTPFWLRANQFGVVPLDNPFAFIRLGGQTTVGADPHKPQLLLQGEFVANAGKTSNFLLPVASATFLFRKFEIYAGRRKEFFGLCDTLLTSGSYAWSGNALPIPKIQIGTRGFVPLGFTKGLFAVHATYAHGWFGHQDSVQRSFLHQKTAFVRLGKPKWKARFYLGIIHNVQWGGESKFVRQSLTVNGKYPSSFKDYVYLIVAKQPRGQYADIDTLNQIGNHLGSIDFGLEVKGKNWDVFAYHQHPFEDKSGLVFVNFPDGLYGVSLKNKNIDRTPLFQLQQMTIEFLTTMDKGGNLRNDLKKRYEADDYFNHSQYIDGWAYRHRIIGTPFIMRYLDMNPEIIDPKYLKSRIRNKMVNNNSVKVIHLGITGRLGTKILIKSHFSLSQNTVKLLRDSMSQLNQFSGVVSFSMPFRKYKTTKLQTSFSYDSGILLHQNVGTLLTLTKYW